MVTSREELIKVYVSRIEMTGFKSFVDRTVVDLEPGITAVVGPNGCGKTNICDAIRWVLGEENVRLLRGARIEDVIFAGTELRKPTGMAEVSLTVADVQDVLPVDYNEVTVTRRVFRSGESQFYINKIPSRLKDIVDLFLGTGMGRRAYSVMERDMIDWILEDGSGQRRKIIEEAAGVSKYKVRRKETVNKLELTQRDLERVQDLISEVERRVRSLARQAAKARRYERLVGRIKEVETYGSVKQYQAMAAKREETAGGIEAIETEIAALARDAAGAEAAIEQKKLAVVEVEKEINAHGGQMTSITDDIQKAENEKIVLSERVRAIEDKVAEIANLKDERRALLKEKADLLDAKRGETEANSRRLEELTKTKARLETEYGAADGELRTRREESVVSARQTIETMRRHIDKASAVTEMRSRHVHLRELLAKSEAKQSELSERAEAILSEISAAEAHLGDLNSTFDIGENEVAKLSEVIEELAGKIERIREERVRLTEQAARASSRHDMFQELVERYEGYETGVKAMMQVAGEGDGVHGVVGDIVRCTDARYEPAVVAALSDAVQYVVVECKKRAADSVRMLKEGKKGSATLVLLDSIPECGRCPDSQVAAEGVIGPIMDFVDCESKYRGLFEYLLDDIFIVEDLEQAFSLSGRGDNSMRSYVTPDGDAIFRGSIVRSGANGHSGDVVIGRKEKVRDLATQAEALKALAVEQDRAFEELAAGHADLIGQLGAKRDGQSEARRLITEREKDLHSKIAERNSLQNTMAELEAEIVGLKETVIAIEEEMAAGGQEGDLAQVGQVDLFDGFDGDAEIEEKVAALQKTLEDTSREILRLQSSNGFLNETTERIALELESLKTGLEDLDRSREGLEIRRRELLQAEEAVKTRVQGLLAVLGEFEEKRRQVLNSKSEIEGEIEEARKVTKTVSRRREDCLSRKQELQSELNLLEVKSDALRQRMVEEYELDIDQVDLEALQACENAEEELASLKGHLKNLGPVNLVALEEYDVEKERYDFLKTQRDDLVKARESLDEAILQINRRARAEFMETFQKVKKDFRRNFQTLFQGGDADLRLRYEADPLESPIDILAQPSGKKLEQISLLSGGERALTAIAFLFAVYYTKPSPFCLLDEVDAPLDDANVMRFVELIKDFSKRTQFMMVTHNKKTMESASCLYGVTMQEPGVSRMVSVRLERAQDEVLEPVG